MADGVRKTFKRRYRENIDRCLAMMAGVDNSDEIAREMADEIFNETGLVPCLANDNGYQDVEFKKLLKYTDEETAKKIQDFTYKTATKETDRATYQAMEALIHNLNTMNSRAGAQTPFSSINYGTDTSVEGRMVIKNVL